MTPGDPFFFPQSVVLAFFVMVTLFVFLFGYFFLFAIYIPALLWHSSAYLLLYFCSTVVAVALFSCTHCGFMGCSCMFFFSAVCCTVLLLYQVLRAAVVGTRWLGGSVRGCVHAFVGYFFFLFLPLYRPCASIVPRTPSTLGKRAVTKNGYTRSGCSQKRLHSNTR